MTKWEGQPQAKGPSHAGRSRPDKQFASPGPLWCRGHPKRPNWQRTGWWPTPAYSRGLVAVHPLRAFRQQTGVW